MLYKKISGILYCGLGLILAAGCQRTVAGFRSIQLAVSSQMVMADGGSRDTLYARLPGNADSAKSIVLFRTATGVFANGKDTISVLADRTDIPQGKKTAYAVWTSSLRAGLDTVWASTETSPSVTDETTFQLVTSLADSIHVDASAFAVPDSFGGEITITASLFNTNGGKVSMGTAVQFSDAYDVVARTPVNGSFRATNALSDSNSQVSTIYNPGIPDSAALAAAKSFIWLYATLINPASSQKPVVDSVRIYVTH